MLALFFLFAVYFKCTTRSLVMFVVLQISGSAKFIVTVTS